MIIVVTAKLIQELQYDFPFTEILKSREWNYKESEGKNDMNRSCQKDQFSQIYNHSFELRDALRFV